MRLKIISGIIAGLFAFLAVTLFYVQIVKGPYYYKLSQDNRIRLIPLPARRGRLYDSDGAVMADSVVSYDIVVVPQELKNDKIKRDTFAGLSRILGVSVKAIEARYRRNYIAPFAEASVAGNVEDRVIYEVEQMNLALPASAVRAKLRRNYPYGESSAHILGYIGEIDTGQLARLRPYGYQWRDFIGKSGIEQAFDTYLKGADGGMQVEVDHRGYQVSVLGRRNPAPGRDIRLTVNAELQKYAYSLIRDKRGAVIVMSPGDGRILAMASAPSFDPNMFYSSDNEPYLGSIFSSAGAPFLNRAIQAEVPPGSIFKIITAVAGIESGRLDPGKKVDCPGSYSLGGIDFGCWYEQGHGWLNLAEAVEHSCNVFFFKLARNAGEKPITDCAQVFNFGRPLGVDLPAEASGLLPDKKWKRKNRNLPWFDGDTLNLAIGQGFILITPLQAAVMTAAVANNGNLVRPYIVDTIDNIKVAAPRIRRLPVSARALRAVREGMRLVVESPDGTGRLARLKGIESCGKTGTAQVSGNAPHAWYVGFAPGDNPKAVVAVFLENAGYGGEQAAPVAGYIFDKMAEMGML